MARKRLTMRKIKEVIRLKYETGLSNRAIAGACKISNSTVGDYLRRAADAGLGWPLDELGDEELNQKLFPESQTIQPEPEYPMPDWGKINTEKRKKGVTLQLLWQEYKEQHPNGYQYSQFCEHYQRWKKQQVEPSMHKEHKGGEEMEVDYAGLKMQMIDPETGEIIKISVFVATLPASNYIYAEPHLNEDQKNWNNGHARAFEYFGGVVKIVVPDNLKTGITKPNYYEPGVNLAYQDLAEYYKFAVLPARVRKPKDKGAAENGVQNVERWVIAPLRKRQFFSFHEVQTAIREQLEMLNHRVMQGAGQSRRQEFEAIDQPNLRPLPERPYEYADWKTATVHIDYHVEFEDHLYSVPFQLIHQKVNIRATEKMVEIFHQGKSVAIHPRNYRKARYSTQRAHMPENHQFMAEINSDKLLEWAEKIGPNTFTLIQATLKSRDYPEQAYRTCLGILKLAKKYRPANMETACQIIYESKVFSYKTLEQELIFLQKKPTSQTTEALPVHKNIRGAEYYPQYIELSFEERLLLLVDMECSRRLDHRTTYRIKLANFPMRASIEELDFSAERGLDRRAILELSQCNWIDKALNIIISGATGTGKSFLACAFGTAACRLGYSVRYLHTARFLFTLEHARQDGSYINFLRSISKSDVLILDDWMRDPIQPSSAQDLLEVFDDRFGKSATIIVSQVPISDWHSRFPDPTLADAILDRTVHNAYRLSLLGDSQRKIRGFRAISHT